MTGAFTAFDWFLIAVVAVSTLMAFFRGIVKVLFSLGGLVLGVLAASWYYAALAPRLTLLPTRTAQQVAAFALLFLGVMVVFTWVAGLIRKALSVAGLGLLDRVLGGLFGFVRGVLVGVACMLGLAALSPTWRPLGNSQLAPYFLSAAHGVCFVLPRDFERKFAAGAAHLLQQSPAIFAPSHAPGESHHEID